jgi:hypothetical protein
LSIFAPPIALGVAPFAFGAFLGLLDVAMNLHAVDVERASDKPLLSGFHARFSLGGFLGSGIRQVEPDRCFGVSVISFESHCLLITLVSNPACRNHEFRTTGCIHMKQKRLNARGDSDGQARVEALRVALNY